jgi:hypothetical protein
MSFLAEKTGEASGFLRWKMAWPDSRRMEIGLIGKEGAVRLIFRSAGN